MFLMDDIAAFKILVFFVCLAFFETGKKHKKTQLILSEMMEYIIKN